MPDPIRLRVLDVVTRERPVRLRLPFRFGIVTMRHTSQLVATVRVADASGRVAIGASASVLAPKWFDKNPALTDADNAQQLRDALALAADAYRCDPTPATPFDLHAAHYRDIVARAAARGLNGLVAGFGPALLDAAIVDAAARLCGQSFYALVRDNRIGLRRDAMTPDLAGFDLDAWLAALTPAADIALRHTVGLVDELDGVPGLARDGQPETLADVVAVHRPRYFKLKVSGSPADDLRRLREIAAVLDRSPTRYLATLDGNEQFAAADGVRELWQAMAADPALARLTASILYIEQPIHRGAWRDHDVSGLADLRPLIIDESDDSPQAFPDARALGYRGVSSKLCKGLYKSLLNAARCRHWSRDGGPFFMSAEDLTNQAGIAVQQDLALVNLLGLRHVERNGHHYVNGFGDTPAAEQQAWLDAHPDLYERIGDGPVRLRIRDGLLAIGSLAGTGFACGVPPSDAPA